MPPASSIGSTNGQFAPRETHGHQNLSSSDVNSIIAWLDQHASRPVPSPGSFAIRDHSSISGRLLALVGLGSRQEYHGGLTIHNLTSGQLTLHAVSAFSPSDLAHHAGSWVDHQTQDGCISKPELRPLASGEELGLASKATWQLETQCCMLASDELVIIRIGTAASRESSVVSVVVIPSKCSSQHLRLESGCQLPEGDAPRASIDLVAIYDSEKATLTIFDAPDTSSWMRAFDDNTSIAALSIPGTHNSPTHHHALPSVRCQAVSPTEQLHHGVRFFDVRVQIRSPDDPADETLYLVHGAFPISLTGHKRFRDLLDQIEAFLRERTSETVILSLKREGLGNGSDAQLADLLDKHYATAWFKEARVPNLGEVRGKIVLMRRFSLSPHLRDAHGAGWGLDAESWPDNTSGAIHGNVNVQDFYRVMNPGLLPKKIEYACTQMRRAAEAVYAIPASGSTAAVSMPAQIFLNFLTAANFGDIRCWPRQIAKRLNPAVRQYLCTQHAQLVCAKEGSVPAGSGDGSLGIVVCDWIGRGDDWDVVDCIIGMNSIRLHKERGQKHKQHFTA